MSSRTTVGDKCIPQTLLLLKGHPGTGKSSLAAEIGKELKWPIVDKDDARDGLTTLEAECGSSSHCYVLRNVLNDISYDIMWRIVERQLSLGLSLIVDSPLSRPHQFEIARRLSECHNCRVFVLECVARDASEWRRRIESRATEALTEDQAARSKPADYSSGSLGDSVSFSVSKNRDSSSQSTELSLDGGETRAADSQCTEPANVRARSIRWHKPTTWADVESLLTGYGDCWKYEISGAEVWRKEVDVTDSSKSKQELIAEVIAWLKNDSGERYLLL